MLLDSNIMKKIIAYKNLSKLINQLRSDRIVLVGGCFDILHLGHIRFLNQAKKYGLVLVALESDTSLKKFKGINRPIHPQKERAEVLSSLDSVNYVILLPPFSKDAQYFKLTKTVSPQIIAVTQGDLQLINKQKQARLVGAKIVVIPKISTPSTTQLAKLLLLE